MKLLVPFVLAAALVVGLAVMALRQPAEPVVPIVETPYSAPQPAPAAPVAAPAVAPPVAAAEEPAAEEPLDQTDFMTLMRDYGFGKLESQWQEWAVSRGYPALGSGSFFLEQPYDQYDDATLRGLAENGDMWAQQILAQRISRSDPAGAIELYRQAAIRGSIYAMTQISNLYAQVADQRREVDFRSNDGALEQIYAMRDAPVSPEVAGYAWTAVAEMAGTEPMFGNIAAAQFARKLSDEQKQEACSIARGMYDDVAEQRSALGLGDFERSPPPMVYWDPSSAVGCGSNDRPSLDLSGCREVRMSEAGETNTVWLCADGP